MSRLVMIVALFLGVLVISVGYPLERLVEPVLTIYLMIAGLLVLIMRGRAWEFIRPMIAIMLALMLLPVLFRGLIGNLRINLNNNIWMGWIWPVLIALVAFILFRLWVFSRTRAKDRKQKILRDRERVMPLFNTNDEDKI